MSCWESWHRNAKSWFPFLRLVEKLTWSWKKLIDKQSQPGIAKVHFLFLRSCLLYHSTQKLSYWPSWPGVAESWLGVAKVDCKFHNVGHFWIFLVYTLYLFVSWSIWTFSTKSPLAQARHDVFMLICLFWWFCHQCTNKVGTNKNNCIIVKHPSLWN